MASIKAPNAAALTGTFAPGLVAFASPTPLLKVEALYNRDTGGGDVDIAITRIGFGALAGLTANQAAVGNGIERAYTPTLTGSFAGLVGNLFLLNDAAYRDALTQLGGDQYAGFVQGLRNQNLQINNKISDQLDCAVAADGLENCNGRDGQIRVWGQAQYNDMSVDSDINAPGYASNNWSALLGADYSTGQFTIGGFAGYRDTRMDFTRNGGQIKADGWQLGMMAAYDTGSFYGRIIGSYSGLGGQSTRTVNILTNTGTIAGNPDTGVTSIYGEFGGRIQVGPAWLTPFAALDYANVKLKSFAETGVPGANLAYSDQNENQTSMLAGLKLAGNLGGIVPEAKVAWRHDLSDTPIGVTARFADAPSGSDFTAIPPNISRSSFVAGFSLAAVLGERFTGRIGYQGRFSSQAKDHAVYGSLVFRFGGAN